MNLRDLEYIENRLIAPASETVEALERMRRAGLHEEAETVFEALRTFTDVCRDVRVEIARKAALGEIK